MLPRNKPKWYNSFSCLQTDVCYETRQSLVRVNTCPENEAAFNERLQEKKCDEYPKCQGKALFYHCVRENEHTLVEVCAPNQQILGKQYTKVKIQRTSSIMVFQSC